MTTVRTLPYPGNRGLGRAELTAAFNDFFGNLDGYGQELNAVASEVNSNAFSAKQSEISAASSKQDCQQNTNTVMAAVSGVLTAQNAAESARDAAVLAASEVGALEVAKMQSYNQRNAMNYFELNPL